jgi:hypothetical protein
MAHRVRLHPIQQVRLVKGQAHLPASLEGQPFGQHAEALEAAGLWE